MKPWILIDVSYLAHKARYTVGDLHYEDFNTGILFGFWEQLITICSDPRINSNRIALFFDSKKSFRRRVFPKYKIKRAEISEEEQLALEVMRDQVNLLRREILPSMGIPTYRQTGCESDDLIAKACAEIIMKGQTGVIITADGDLYQCINEYIKWYDPTRRKLLTFQNFKTEKGIPANSWGLVKSIAGCSGDDVPGIPGVGEPTAIKYLNGDLPERYKAFQKIESEEGQAIIQRNKELVILPHRKTKDIHLRDPEYKPEEFFKMSKRYGFLSYLRDDRKREWMRFFKGDDSPKPKIRKRRKK